MLMTAALNPAQCDTVRQFFALLLRIKAINRTRKGIDVGVAFQLWHLQEHNMTYAGIHGKKQADRLHSSNSSRYDNRREWMEANQQGTAEEAAEAWGVKQSVAMQWMYLERKRMKAQTQ